MNMNKITSSATKLVLLYITFILGLMTMYTVGLSIFRQTLNPELVWGAFASFLGFLAGYYFRNGNTQPESEVKDTPAVG